MMIIFLESMLYQKISMLSRLNNSQDDFLLLGMQDVVQLRHKQRRFRAAYLLRISQRNVRHWDAEKLLVIGHPLSSDQGAPGETAK